MTQSTDGAVITDFPDIDDVEDTSLESGNSDPEPTFEEKVNAATKAMTQNEDGTWKVPEGLPEEVAYAATLEKRRRDTQSALAKTQQQTKALEAERNALRERAVKGAISNLTIAQKEELEDLKSNDPDAWLAKKTEYEQSALTAVDQELAELSESSNGEAELERRGQVLQQFLDDNPGLILNDAVFENDLPPRITSKLAKGEVSFEEFLEEAKKFLTPGTTIKGTDDTDDDEPNLGKAGGGSTASESSIAQASLDDYRNEIY